jgi:hypothetical protein
VASLSCGTARGVAYDGPTALPTPCVIAASPIEYNASTARVDPPCPLETHWDGLACAHARATCGRWDGLTCEPRETPSPDQERAAKEEFARIDGEARTVCPDDDESSQVYLGDLSDVSRAVDTALHRAGQIGERLAQLRDAQRTPRWDVATHARIGTLNDCIWNSLRKATPPLFTPQQQAGLTKLNRMASLLISQGNVSAGQQIQAQIVVTRQQVADTWRVTRDKYLATLEREMVLSYVTTALLARRYAFEGFDITRASERLQIIASILGDEAMSHLLADMPDPTDPAADVTKRRRVTYAAGTFRVAP